MLRTTKRFILIDDDFVSNLLSSIVIEGVANGVEIKTFENPEEGLEFIRAQYAGEANETILFLDINMPVLSGWEFLENFENFDEKISGQFKIFMLSSSLDPADQERARENNYVVDYIEKPLNEKSIMAILTKLDEVI